MIELRLSELAKSKATEEVTVVFRDMSPPDKPPYVVSPNTEVVDFDSPVYKAPSKGISAVFGGRPTVRADKIIEAIVRDIGETGYSLHMSDKQFTMYSMWEVRSFITSHDTTKHMQYVPEVFDCDDFAQVLQGNVNRVLQGIPFGTIWYDFLSGFFKHAVNIGYCHIQDRMYLVEPQTDEFYFFNNEAWQARLIVI